MRKITVFRSLFSYLQTYGYTGANPAQSDFVATPPVLRDDKTVGLSPEDCRRILEAPSTATAAGIRDRALFAVLAYTGCRVGELTRLRVCDYKLTGGHRVQKRCCGKVWQGAARAAASGGSRAARSVAGRVRDARGAFVGPIPADEDGARPGQGWIPGDSLSRRAVQRLVARYVALLRLDSAVTVHSFRVTALTTARERGSGIIDLKDFAGHSDPRSTLTYIRGRDRLSKSSAYVLTY